MLKYSANISTLMRDHPLEERLQRVSEAGINGFEFLFVSTFGLPRLISAQGSSGLEVVLFDLETADPTLKTDYGYLCNPDAGDEFRRSLDEGLEAARQLGCRRLNSLVGMAAPGASWEEQRDLVVQRLQQAAALAADAGVILLVEAIANSMLPGYLVNYSRQAVEIVDLVDQPNVRFQDDLFQMQLMEGNLIATLTKNIDKIGHVQVADVPGRHEPGTGEINFPNVLRALEETGYTGYVGLEYVPITDDPFAWLAEMGEAERSMRAA